MDISSSDRLVRVVPNPDDRYDIGQKGDHLAGGAGIEAFDEAALLSFAKKAQIDRQGAGIDLVGGECLIDVLKRAESDITCRRALALHGKPSVDTGLSGSGIGQHANLPPIQLP